MKHLPWNLTRVRLQALPPRRVILLTRLRKHPRLVSLHLRRQLEELLHRRLGKLLPQRLNKLLHRRLDKLPRRHPVRFPVQQRHLPAGTPHTHPREEETTLLIQDQATRIPRFLPSHPLLPTQSWLKPPLLKQVLPRPPLFNQVSPQPPRINQVSRKPLRPLYPLPSKHPSRSCP